MAVGPTADLELVLLLTCWRTTDATRKEDPDVSVRTESSDHDTFFQRMHTHSQS